MTGLAGFQLIRALNERVDRFRGRDDRVDRVDQARDRVDQVPIDSNA